MNSRNTLLALLALASAFWTGCSFTVPQVHPSATLSALDRPAAGLKVLIDPGISNRLGVTSREMKKANFADYRLSLENGFRAAFTEHFKTVEFVDAKPASGAFIHLLRASPRHYAAKTTSHTVQQQTPGVIIATKKSATYVPGTSYDTTTTEIDAGIEIEWEAVLYRDGVQAGRSSGKLASDTTFRQIHAAPGVLQNALELFFEKLGSDLFGAKVMWEGKAMTWEQKRSIVKFGASVKQLEETLERIKAQQ